jgi:hypothetical protein
VLAGRHDWEGTQADSEAPLEQPRHPAFAYVSNQGRSEKIGAFARATTVRVVATDLYLMYSSKLGFRA